MYGFVDHPESIQELGSQKKAAKKIGAHAWGVSMRNCVNEIYMQLAPSPCLLLPSGLPSRWECFWSHFILFPQRGKDTETICSCAPFWIPPNFVACWAIEGAMSSQFFPPAGEGGTPAILESWMYYPLVPSKQLCLHLTMKHTAGNSAVTMVMMNNNRQ